MKQTSLGLGQSSKRTRRRVFLEEMDRVVPWSDLVALISPYMPEGRRGRPPFAVEVMLRVHFMQQWFNLSDPAMEEALHDMALFRDFAGLGGWDDRVPDETTILRFRRVLEKHKLAPKVLQTINDLLRSKGLMLRAGTVVDATLIAAPSSTKNADGERDPEMKQSKKGNQWYFGMKAHIGVDAESGLRQAAVDLDALADLAQRKDYIDANRDKWAAVRAYLSGMSHGKCWYSEAREAVSRYQVDHFRPHGRSKQAAKQYSEGYSWLAFDIENFRLAGVLCNTVNQEFSEDSVGKGDWFPLMDPARRATLQNRGTAQETPVLLDPTDPDDPYKLWFDEDGNVAPDSEMPADQRAAVEEAIACLGLRQSRLNERRRAVLRRATRAAMRFKEASRVPAGARTVRDIANLNEARAELLAMSAPSAEFAAAVRCLLVAYGLRQLVRTDELAPLAMAPDQV